jgi:hypothetical protein
VAFNQRLAYLSALRSNTPDANQSIADTALNIRATHPVHSLAIWGWAPGVYVLTGLPPVTRDSIIGLAIGPTASPMKTYFRQRFLQDLGRSQPDMFIDTISRGTYMWWDWTEDDGFESFPELRDYIEKNYTLVQAAPVQSGAKPIRYYLRRTASGINP